MYGLHEDSEWNYWKNLSQELKKGPSGQNPKNLFNVLKLDSTDSDYRIVDLDTANRILMVSPDQWRTAEDASNEYEAILSEETRKMSPNGLSPRPTSME